MKRGSKSAAAAVVLASGLLLGGSGCSRGIPPHKYVAATYAGDGTISKGPDGRWSIAFPVRVPPGQGGVDLQYLIRKPPSMKVHVQIEFAQTDGTNVETQPPPSDWQCQLVVKRRHSEQVDFFSTVDIRGVWGAGVPRPVAGAGGFALSTETDHELSVNVNFQGPVTTLKPLGAEVVIRLVQAD